MTRNDAPDVWEYSLLKGAVCLGLAGAAFVLIAGIVRWLSGSVPLLQIAFIQQIVVVALVALPRAVSGQVRMTSVGHGRHMVRAMLTGAAILLGFLAVSHMPVAEVTAILFSRMVFTAILAKTWLGERFSLVKAMGIAVAAAGGVVVLDPSFGEVNIYGWAAVGSAAAMSLSMLMIRWMRSEPREAIVGRQAIWLAVGLAPGAISVWADVSWMELAGCLATGLLLWFSQHMNVFAFRYAEPSAIQSVEAFRLVVALVIDLAVFGILPEDQTMLGGALVVLATGIVIFGRRDGGRN